MWIHNGMQMTCTYILFCKKAPSMPGRDVWPLNCCVVFIWILDYMYLFTSFMELPGLSLLKAVCGIISNHVQIMTVGMTFTIAIFLVFTVFLIYPSVCKPASTSLLDQSDQLPHLHKNCTTKHPIKHIPLSYTWAQSHLAKCVKTVFLESKRKILKKKNFPFVNSTHLHAQTISTQGIPRQTYFPLNHFCLACHPPLLISHNSPLCDFLDPILSGLTETESCSRVPVNNRTSEQTLLIQSSRALQLLHSSQAPHLIYQQ